MVSSQTRAGTEAALAVLENGGNAADAAITLTLLEGVLEPHQNHLFGSMTGIYYDAAKNEYQAFNGYIERPLEGRCGSGDATKVAIGGKMPVLRDLASRYGSQPWASYVEPAIAAAENGVEMTSFMYGVIFTSWGTDNFIRGNPEARAFYMPDGHLVPVGERWKMPALASTLRKLQADPDHMVSGEFVQGFIDKARAKGGCISLADYADYEVLWQAPVRFNYRDHEIISEPPPVAGGTMLAYNLNILQHLPLQASGHYTQSIDGFELLARTLARVENEVRWSIADPRQFTVPTDIWLSAEYGKLSAQIIQQTLPKSALTAPSAPETARLDGGADIGKAALPGTDPQQLESSNHSVIVDSQGNWITFLHTMHGGMEGIFHEGVGATGSGRFTHTRGAGRRASTHVTATFVAKDGKPVMAMGSPGQPNQPITQALVSILDFGMTPVEAIEAPKFWAYQHLGPNDGNQISRDFHNYVTVQMESRMDDSVRKGIPLRGMKAFERGDYMWNVGSIQMVWREADGSLRGTSDPRRLGYAAGR
jgi:gamma-glutamyltranspeptidase / glutathione hydrolase